jgi:hypothetical protein
MEPTPPEEGASPVALRESLPPTPVAASADVVVCGGGPAGVAAALAAARRGADTVLIEAHGCLGGVWTAGALSWIIDHENKRGLMAELLGRVAARGGRAVAPDGRPTSAYDVEAMKAVLEEICVEARVRVRLHTLVASAAVNPATRHVTHAVTESRSGREAWSAAVFVDATGDGTLAARASCGFDVGRPGEGEGAGGGVQPMTLMALLGGIRAEQVRPFINGEGAPWGVPHRALRAEIERATGESPSYSFPTLFRVRDDLFALMANHQYGVRCDDAGGVSRATVGARAELHRIVDGLRALGGPWAGVRIVATGAQIGVREGRRVHGRYTLTAADLERGARFEDAVCRATFCVDIHSTDPKAGKGLGDGGVRARPYDIPLRSLVAADAENLLLAGRCISGDFFAHASYRVTGNAVATGEAAGAFAALCARTGRTPCQIPTGEAAAFLRDERLAPTEA